MKTIVICLVAVILSVSSLFSQEKDSVIQRFKDRYPGELIVRWDSTSGGPKKIMGSNIHLKSRSVDKSNIHGLAKEFINENVDLFNIRNTELQLEAITELNNKFIITYQQLYKNIPLWNVKLRLKVADDGQVLMVKSPCFSSPDLTVQPKISLDEAKRTAAVSFNTDPTKVHEGELLIYPERETGKLYLCWHLKIESGEINKGIMIDAQTAQRIFEYDLYRNAEIRGTVRTTTWNLPGQLGGSPDITPYCQDLLVNVTGVGSANSNSSGYYSVSVPSSGNYTVTSSLYSPHCWVQNYSGSNASYSNTASTSSDHNWTWEGSNHYNEYFVFHYMNNVWHEFNNKVSGFSSNYWHSNSMIGYANEDFAPGTANGYATGTYISMTPLNHFGCSVYHEYSHNVIYQARGFWLGAYYYGDGSAMDEGLSDYYSCSFRNDPLRYAVSRRLDGKMKYYSPGPPEDYQHDCHIRGQIIGGACWDLGHKYGMSLDYVNGLVYESVVNIDFESTFGDFMDEMLSADDNDGNIFNGTPHDAQICEAFISDHGIMGDPALYYAVLFNYAFSNQSVSSQATAFNSQRKFYRESSGKLHEVFTSGTIDAGEIFYRNSIDNGATWNVTTRLSDGTATSLAPCITVGPGPTVIVVWQQKNGSNYNVAFSRSTSGGSNWIGISTIQSNFSCASPGPLPSVSDNTNTGSVVVVYRTSSGLRYVYSTSNMASWNGPYTVPNTNGNYNSPTSALYPLASPMADKGNLAFSTSVGYPSRLYYGYYWFSEASWSSFTDLSSALPSSYQGHTNPSLAVSSTSTTTVHVAWEATLMGPSTPVLVHRKGSSGNFGSQYYVIQYQYPHIPSITGLTSDNAWMVFQNSTTSGIHTIQYSNSGGSWIWGTPTYISPGNYPQLSVGSSNAKYLWTSGASTPYTIAIGSGTLNKAVPLAVAYSRELNFIDTKTRSSITLEMRQPQIVYKDGTIALIPFVDAPPDSVIIDPKEILSYGNTQSIAASIDIDALKVQYCIRTVKSGDMVQQADASVSFALCDVTTGKVLATIGTQAIVQTSDTTSNSYQIEIAAGSIRNLPQGSEISIRPSVVGVKEDSPDMIASLGHIFRYGTEGAPQLPKAMLAEAVAAKENLLEQNYPNPFNPVTQINYSILKDGYVTLKVFDILGRQVATLVDGAKAAGSYTAMFDGSKLSSGVYLTRFLVRPQDGSKTILQTRKIVLAK